MKGKKNIEGQEKGCCQGMFYTKDPPQAPHGPQASRGTNQEASITQDMALKTSGTIEMTQVIPNTIALTSYIEPLAQLAENCKRDSGK